MFTRRASVISAIGIGSFPFPDRLSAASSSTCLYCSMFCMATVIPDSFECYSVREDTCQYSAPGLDRPPQLGLRALCARARGIRVCVATTSRGHKLCEVRHSLTICCGRVADLTQ